MSRVHRSNWWSRLRDDYSSVVSVRPWRVVAFWAWMLLLVVLLALNVYFMAATSLSSGLYGIAGCVVAAFSTRIALGSWARLAAMRRHPSAGGLR